jgi:hypothetical protein
MFDIYEDRDYEYNAREDYIRELQAEHFDPFWNVDPNDNPEEDEDIPGLSEYQKFDEDIPY